MSVVPAVNEPQRDFNNTQQDAKSKGLVVSILRDTYLLETGLWCIRKFFSSLFEIVIHFDSYFNILLLKTLLRNSMMFLSFNSE
jgi:hypothetical protein